MSDKPDFVEIHCKLNDDGTITGGAGKYEHFAVLLSEGFEINEAWEGAGYKLTDGSKKMRLRLTRTDVFQARVANLKAQKAELGVLMSTREVSPEHETFKEVRWMALQTWRRAFAKDDIKTMAAMTNVLLGLGQRQMPAAPAAPQSDAPAEETVNRGPGRPATEPPNDGMPSARDRLRERGVPLPGKAA